MAKVLVIDDEPNLVKLVASRLKSGGHEVLSAENGKIGFDLAKKEKPDIILLDIQMPVMDGWETLEALKKENTTKDIPVVMVTARGDTSDLVKSMAEGKAADYVMKPYVAVEFLKKINRLLSPEKRIPENANDETMLSRIEEKVKKTLKDKKD
jgi:DNA-binding response OmpR family regulator